MQNLRNKSWGQHKKSYLDKIIEYFRFIKINEYIKENSIILDLGCGYNGELISHYRDVIAKGIGIDVRVKSVSDKKISLIKSDLNSRINLPSKSFDIITMLAVIEHLKLPDNTVKESYRLLKKDGLLIITTPNIRWRWLLELLANLKLIDPNEINDHKRYYSQKTLISCLVNQGFDKNKIKTTTYPVNKFIDFVVLAVAQK